MMNKLLIATAMSLSLGATSALAQTAGTGTAATGAAGAAGAAAGAGMHGQMQAQMPAQWEGDIAGAFYEDAERGTLRADEDEIRTGWDDLDEDDRQAVRDFCEQFAMDTGALEQEGAAAGAAVTGQAGATGTAGTTGATGQVAGQAGTAADPAADLDAMTHHASLQRICAMVEDWDGDA